MVVKKKKLGDIERCYAVAVIEVAKEQQLVFASEGEGGVCYAYSGESFDTQTTVWENAGGTMSFVPIPGRPNEFLATQNFFPGFNALTSKVVYGKFENNRWTVVDYMTIPYLHRFDLLAANGVTYFIGATLCSSKKEREDWSDPGKILVGALPEDMDKTMELSVLKDGLVKNHGYWRSNHSGVLSGYVTADNGVFAVTPPAKQGSDWTLSQLTAKAVSDIGVYDLDGDGELEYALLYPFHGDGYSIFKESDGELKEVYSYPKLPKLSHAVWTGMLNGIPTLIGGYRQDDAELFLVRYNKESKSYETHVLDSGTGPTNVTVLHRESGDIIAAANKQFHEAAIYFVED